MKMHCSSERNHSSQTFMCPRGTAALDSSGRVAKNSCGLHASCSGPIAYLTSPGRTSPANSPRLFFKLINLFFFFNSNKRN